MKYKVYILVIVVVLSLAGCADKNLELQSSDTVECKVTRAYRDTSYKNSTCHIEIYDEELDGNVTLNVSSKDYSQITVNDILKIKRDKYLDKKENVYRYRYSLTYDKLPEESEIEDKRVEYAYVTIIDKYSTRHTHRTGKVSHTTYKYHIVYEDTETGKSQEELIDSESYNNVVIGEKYKAFRTKLTDTDGKEYYKYELVRKSQIK